MKVLKKLDRPVLFLGLPVNLAFAYAICFLLGVVGTMLFVVNDNYVLCVIPVIGMLYGMYKIKSFYSKYGHKGFAPAQRDKSIPNQFSVDKVFNKMIQK
ncbi:hypothetical protein [Chryseobacterium sp. 5_R23647]|uniref:hypothetical protein n=1 Tax=Chryseobacterium sp. 5_R23647 TaxID=2258964 RepID=UPI000E24DC1D|nr:hypothetical protein [Chryseobacterium sp. 5_R23647]REC40549.1 hypothetical protein DRF69_18240 [Chryseobacterium sp. 5_R23647]